MSRWLVSVPAWGESYVRVLETAGAPALLAAADRLPEPVKFLVHTDAPDRVRAIFAGRELEVRAVGNHPTYVALQRAHAEAVASAAVGERVVLLNADIVVSGNLLARCAEHFAAGCRAVVLLGIRTLADPELPPAGADPRALLSWAWDHRHQIIRDLEWPQGGSMVPTNLFWSAGASVVARGFHLHPAAIVKHGDISFRSTIDGDLLDCFPREAVRVVVDPGDCAMCEVSPLGRRFPVRGLAFKPEHVAKAMKSRASDTHCWLFEHRIVIRGSGEEVTEDGPVAAEILRVMGQMPLAEAAPPPRGTPAPSPRVRPPRVQRGRVPARRL